MQVLGLDESIASQAYDNLMSMFSADGKLDFKALGALSRSYIELAAKRTEGHVQALHGRIPSEIDRSIAFLAFRFHWSTEALFCSRRPRNPLSSNVVH